MAVPFPQTLRALGADRSRGALLALVVAFVLVATWLGWFLGAPVTVYVASQSARVETERVALPIHAPLGGRVVGLTLRLGQSVQSGDVLVELDAEVEKRRLIEEQTRLAALLPEIEAVGRELRAREQSIQDDRLATRVGIDQARARQQQAESDSVLSREELSRSVRMQAEGVLPELALLRVRADAERRDTEREVAALELIRQGRDQRTRASKSTSDVEELGRELAILKGRRAVTAASIDALLAEIDRRTIRAAGSGTVEDSTQLAVGSYVREGDRLGTIVPAGELRIVAEFEPSTAVGRVRSGQAARLRFDGVPWSQFGAPRARVSQVASEVRAGQVRVELALEPGVSPSLRLQHGMTAGVEVEIEHATPAELVLRAAGKALRSPLGPPRPSATPEP